MLKRRDVLQLAAGAAASVAVGAGILRSRRSYLKDVEAGTKAPLRPPGALPESEFIERCIRCNQCSDVCENQCIRFIEGSAAHGTPEIRPRDKACILCMKCTKVCPTGALQTVDPPDGPVILDRVRMGTAVVDKHICNSYNGLVCGVCVNACPFSGRALKAGMWERPLVDPDVCVGCGLCENQCIVYPQAIRVVPASQKGGRGEAFA